MDPCLKDALERLGYEKLFSFVKKRQKFVRADGLELVFDEFDDGEKFLEFRIKDVALKTEIPGLLKKLGIRKKEVTRKSYIEIMSSKKTSV